MEELNVHLRLDDLKVIIHSLGFRLFCSCKSTSEVFSEENDDQIKAFLIYTTAYYWYLRDKGLIIV